MEKKITPFYVGQEVVVVKSFDYLKKYYIIGHQYRLTIQWMLCLKFAPTKKEHYLCAFGKQLSNSSHGTIQNPN